MRSFIGLLLLPMALLFIVPAHATTPTNVTGAITQIGKSTITVTRTSDMTQFYTFSASDLFTGGIQGQLSLSLDVVQTSTLATANGGGTLTGTVGSSQSGTVEVHFILQATVISGTITSVQGQLIFGQGTGGLAGLHGQGTLQATLNEPATYSVDVHFDPA